jgi:anhydro-N-acetylmuramic acid kinase
MARGGQGAPLVPLLHRAIACRVAQQWPQAAGHADQEPRPRWPMAVVNIGGVANVTLVRAAAAPPLAWDAAPGNALLDDWVARHRPPATFDADGAEAAAGAVLPDVLALLAAAPFLAAPPPKSLDRNSFDALLRRCIAPLDHSAPTFVQDVASTLLQLTVDGIVHSVGLVLPDGPSQAQPPVATWVVCGGGRHNKELMRRLRERAAPAVVMAVDDVGLDGDAVEAVAFALLAVRSLRNLPLSFPSTTGVRAPCSGGCLHRH